MTDLSLAAGLSAFAAALGPLVDTALRVCVGLLLIPHGMRMALGFFPETGLPIKSLPMMIAALDKWGYRPGWLWAPLIAGTQLICGPLLVLGLLTRLAAIPVSIFLLVSCFERWRVGGWFWNTFGMEYTVLWAIAALWVLAHGGGPYSLDRWLGI